VESLPGWYDSIGEKSAKSWRKKNQGLLGHRNIKTTERYVNFVPSHASEAVIEAQRKEDIEIALLHRRQIGDIGESKSVASVIH
jgi:hypothetical protein